jgi:pullulanase/glycogen debranching enzyme
MRRKNFLAVTLLSLGTPMLLMGDEVRRTQGGNNNAYCQDNEISWFDWTLLERHRDLHRFVKTLIGHRLAVGGRPGVQGLSLNELLRRGEIEVHGVRLRKPDLSPSSHSLAVTVWDSLRRGWGSNALKLRTTRNGSSARRDWHFEPASDSVLVLRVSGGWRMHDHLPSRMTIEHGLGVAGNAPRAYALRDRAGAAHRQANAEKFGTGADAP